MSLTFNTEFVVAKEQNLWMPGETIGAYNKKGLNDNPGKPLTLWLTSTG